MGNSLRVNFATAIARHRKLAQAKFGPAILPIYLTNERHQPVHLASCMLLKVRGAPFLMTAAHVIDERNNGSLYVGGKAGLISIETDFFSTTTPRQGRAADIFDFAVGPIPSVMLEDLGGAIFITEADFAAEPLTFHGHVFTALGYPNSRNKKRDHAKHHIKSEIWPYSATVLTDTTSLKRKLEISGDEHVFIKFEKKSRTEACEIVNSPSPRGVSGGALIDLGNLARLEMSKVSAQSEARLAGVLIEHRREYKTIIATRVTTIVAALSARGIM